MLGSAVTESIDLDGGGIDPETETGLYAFDSLAAGEYTVREIPPAGWTQTDPDFEPGPDRAGVVFTVGATTKHHPSVAFRDNGEFVFVWENGDIYARIFHADGTPDGGGLDGNSEGVFAQRFDAAGVPIGGEFLVNTVIDGGQKRPNVAMAGSGEFVIAYRAAGHGNLGEFAQMYHADGTPNGGEFRIGEDVYSEFFITKGPVVAMDAGGNFTAVYARAAEPRPSCDIFATMYGPDGSVLAAEFPVTQTPAFNGGDLAVAAAPTGGAFIAAWSERSMTTFDLHVLARRYGGPEAAHQYNTIELADDETRSGVDFGNSEASSIRGQKFEDLDGNGQRDAGEPGLGGGRRGQLRGRLDQSRPGRRRRRRIRPNALCRRNAKGRGVSGQHLHARRPGASPDRDGRCGRLRDRLGQQWPGRNGNRRLCAAIRCRWHAAGRGVPRQYRHGLGRARRRRRDDGVGRVRRRVGAVSSVWRALRGIRPAVRLRRQRRRGGVPDRPRRAIRLRGDQRRGRPPRRLDGAERP